MKIVLIGNYPPDGQQSMERFAMMLESGFLNAGNDVAIWRPSVIAGRLGGSPRAGLGKWLGYVDKWIVFPLILRWRALSTKATRFHICDHSNAPYLGHLPPERTSITCHDVLAIRGALGHADAHCQSSRFGLILQKWILGHLAEASKLASVSELTLKQLEELTPEQQSGSQRIVINNAFNESFQPMPTRDSAPLLGKYGLDEGIPFILHVGSDLPRKNRKMLLNMVDKLGGNWSGKICFAGQAMDSELSLIAESLGLKERIVEVESPDHRTLVALYSTCLAFVFPSYSEGFGWPVIEAQACGVPIIASNVEPMPEVSGGAAIHVDPDDTEGFAAALLKIASAETRSSLVQLGLENSIRFTPEKMINSYLNLMKAS